MKIADKWKLMAVGHYFSNDFGAKEGLEFYARLMAGDTEKDIADLLDSEPDVLIWQEFEYMSRKDMQASMEALATHAQELENMKVKVERTAGWYVVWYWDDGAYVNRKFMDYDDAVEFAKEHEDD